MAYPIAAGSVVSPAYSGTFIPEIWSAKLIEKFYAACILASVSNTDYEGEIKNQGDKVKMRTRPTISIHKHNIGDEIQYERPTSPIIELNIDQGLRWGCIEDDVIGIQSDVKVMNLWSEDAAEQMKIELEREVFGSIVPMFDAANRGIAAGKLYGNINLGATGAPLALTKVNLMDHLVDLNEVLSQQNIPETDRFFILPLWASSLLKKGDLKDANMMGDSVSVARNGQIGRIDNSHVYQSVLLPNVTDTGVLCSNIIAGNKKGLTFASQLVKLRSQQSERVFGNVMSGLHVYGFKVIQPTAMAASYVYKG